MGGADEVIQCEQGAVGVGWFRVHDIQRRHGQRSFFQGLEKSLFINEAAAGSVYQAGRWFHLLEGIVVEYFSGFLG